MLVQLYKKKIVKYTPLEKNIEFFGSTLKEFLHSLHSCLYEEPSSLDKMLRRTPLRG